MITVDQLDAVLPRVPAGIPALTADLTDDEERAVALRWLVELYREAECVEAHRSRFGANDIRHGDTWEARNGRAVVVASNDWPAPKAGHRILSERVYPPAPGITYHDAEEAK